MLSATKFNIILIVWVLVIIALIWFLAVKGSREPIRQENNLQGQTESNLALLQGNSLISLSPVWHPQVLADIITIEEPNWLFPLIMCESGGRKDARGEAGEIGLLQFMPKTFYHYAEVYGFGEPDIWNAEQQIWLAKKMIGDGLENKWTCWGKIGY